MEAFAKESREGQSGASGLSTSSNKSVQRLFLSRVSPFSKNLPPRLKVGASKTNRAAINSMVSQLGSYQGTIFSMTVSW